jgi:integrase
MAVNLRKRKLSKKKTQLFLDITHNGKRIRESLGIILIEGHPENKKKLRLGEAIRSKRELEIYANKYQIEPEDRQGTNIFLFTNEVCGTKSEIHANSFFNAMRYLERFAGSKLTFDQLTPLVCEGFKQHLIKNLHPNTANSYFARFTSIIRSAIKEGIITKNPALGITIRKQESLPKYLTLEEIQKLVETSCGSEIVKDAFLFSCLTGLRYEDVVSLKWENVRGFALEFTQKKTKSSERLPLAPEAIEIIERQRYAVKNPKVTIEHTLDTIFILPARQTIDKVLRSWAKRAGLIKPLSFHKARHTFATLALSSGVDLYTVSKLLGHKSVVTTSVYAKVVDETKKEAIAKLPRIEKTQLHKQ